MATANYRFIVVDDEPDVRRLVRDVLSRKYPTATILEAANGKEAQEVFQAQGADLMIIDHHIPLLDGLSLVRFLRAQNVKIPLVMMSNNPHVENEAPRAGATHFVNKLKLYESLEELVPKWIS